MADTEETTLSIPSLLVTLAILGLLIRHFFFRSSNTQAAAGFPGAQRQNRIPDATIDMVAGMFPQLSRRDIEWDLRRNGGSVQATSERVLRSGGLDTAPPSFRPQTPPVQPSPSNTASSSSRGGPKQPDLIARYNLSSRIAESSASSEAANEKGSWSSSKTERADALKRRREEMVLEARRRMIERQKAA